VKTTGGATGVKDGDQLWIIIEVFWK